MDKRLKLTKKQTEAWENFRNALGEVYSAGIDIVTYDFTTLCAVNASKIKDYVEPSEFDENTPDTIINAEEDCHSNSIYVQVYNPPRREVGIIFKK